VKFSKTLNSKYHEAAVTFSPDKQTIYFTRNNYGKKLRRDNKGVNHLKIYMSRKVSGKWTEAVELPFNGENYSTGHPALSPDGKQLYFVSDMPGSIGETDIFVVDVLEDGGYSEPRNLGPEINTEKKEMFPFINDSKLYFSSNGHIGLGGLDIYEVSFSEEEEGFLEVRNLGKPINSNKDDFSYIINEETQKGFFASNRRGGKGDDDLYSFQRLIPEEANESAIAGVITDLITGEVIPDAMVTLLDENNMKLKEVQTDTDGSFVFEELEGNTRYTVSFDKEGYSKLSEQTDPLDNQRIEMEISMQKLDDRIVVEDGIRKLKTENIYFNFDKYTIRDDAAAELDKLVGVMTEYPTMVIAIESHTDSRGPAVYNKYLSEQRAKSTRAYLIRKGIDPSRIARAEGFGEARLLNECDGTVRCSREKHQLNRRSEFIIVNM
jgi:outer membrane protein OmpA-like peptidoglycan-associated protein